MSEAFHCGFCEWAAKHATRIQEDGLEYDGVLVTEETEVVSYRWTVSLLVMTLNGETKHRPVDRDSGATLPTFMTILLGWWGFPWGPINSIGTILHNIAGGERSTVAGIIAQAKWGIKNVTSGTQVHVQPEHAPVRFSEAAELEINERRARGQFSIALAVKLLVDNARKRTCLIQFDYPASNGDQTVFRASPFILVIDNRDLEFFQDQTIDFDEDEFLLTDRVVPH